MALAIAGHALPVMASEAETFVVTTTADSGPGSLRAAIVAANGAALPDSGSNTIAFAVPGGGVHTIKPLSPLPDITQAVAIDGYTQPGSSVNTLGGGASNAVLLIVIDGSLAGASDGLHFVTGSGPGSVRGLVINRFARAGICVDVTNVAVMGNFIGTDAGGSQPRGNGSGVRFVSGDLYSGLTVGQYDKVGTLVPSVVNVISGNLGPGIQVVAASDAAYPMGARIRNNLIGADASGKAALGNGGDGIEDAAIGSSGTFGGSSIADNVIVANGGNGISEFGHGTMIVDNLIGVGIGNLGADGPALGNAGDGVHVGGNAIAVTLADQRFSNAFAAGHASIAHNGGAGLYIAGTSLVDAGNQGFYDNGGLGIDIAPDGVNANDAGDIDDGPNERLNAPVLDTVAFDPASGFGDLAGHVDSNPGLTVEVHVYLGDACDASGHGEGAQLLRFDSWTTGTLDTDASGHTVFTVHSVRLLPGRAVTAITRRFAESTPYPVVSEFSNCLVVPGNEMIFADGFDGS